MKYIIFQESLLGDWFILPEDKIRVINYTKKSLAILNRETSITYLNMLTSLYTYEEASRKIAGIAAGEDPESILNDPKIFPNAVKYSDEKASKLLDDFIKDGEG